MNIFFYILCIVHILFWLFIMTAFLNKTTAEYNLYYVIPILYIIHVLPFHILISLKECVEPENTKEKVYIFENNNILTIIFYKLQNMFSFSTFNPLSPQGMMIFGAITSAWALKLDKFLI
jgi:hypothetical protein